MQLKVSTDYGIRIVMYIALKNNPVSIDELSEEVSISKDHINKFCNTLCNSRILKRSEAIEDGFLLGKDPIEISMFDIIVSMENTIKINCCLEDEEYCSARRTKVCPVRRFYSKLQNNIETCLKKTTIKELLSVEE